jgi:COP9 signalosome complex subunit 6
MSITITLSPLVIMNITDHYTRMRYIKDSLDAQVFGVLLGKQQGKNIRILHSFETKLDEELLTIDKPYTNQRLESYVKMFTDFEFLGWYTTCTTESEQKTNEFEVGLNKQFEYFRENPLFLKMNLSMEKRLEEEKKGQSKKDMSLQVYERNENKEFVRCDYVVEPSETERIALDDAKKDISSTKDKSHLSVNLVSTLNSIKLLRKSVLSLVQIIKNVPEIKKNHEIMRQITSICNRLPLISDKDEYSSELFIEYSDILLINQLGVLNKAVEQVQEFNAHKAIKNIDELFA